MRAHNFGTYGRAPPGKTSFRTPVPSILLIRMRSQVQVLAGPPLFSQLRGLLRPGHSRSLPAWAASGPYALRTIQPKDPPRADAPEPRSITARPARGRRLRSSPGHGRLDAGKHALTTCAAMLQMSTARMLFPDRRAVLARNRLVPGRPGGRTWPAARVPPTPTARSISMSPLARHGLRRLRGPSSGSGR
jgi:hypothetical protein